MHYHQAMVEMPEHPRCKCNVAIALDDRLEVVIPAKKGHGYTLVTEYTIECVACEYRLYMIMGDAWQLSS